MKVLKFRMAIFYNTQDNFFTSKNSIYKQRKWERDRKIPGNGRNIMIRKRSSKAISDCTNSSRIPIPNTTRTRGAILFFLRDYIYVYSLCLLLNVYCSCTARVLFRVGTPHSSAPLRITSWSVLMTSLLMRVQYLSS